MHTLIFVLASPNGADGSLSTISLSRSDRAITLQKERPETHLIATGGFGPHFNVSATPHRDHVHRYLIAQGARVDTGAPTDLLSTNTVEDVLLISHFANRRGCRKYGVMTSRFHMARCRFIFECLCPDDVVEFFAADDPAGIDPQVLKHEAVALAGLKAQGGVLVDGTLHTAEVSR